MSRNPPSKFIDRRLTAEEFLALWHVPDNVSKRRARMRVDRNLILARCFAAIAIVTIVVGIGPLLRAIGRG